MPLIVFARAVPLSVLPAGAFGPAAGGAVVGALTSNASEAVLSAGFGSGVFIVSVAVTVFAPPAPTFIENRIRLESLAARKLRLQSSVVVPVQPEPRS